MKTIFDLRFWAIGGWFTFVAVAIGGSALIGAGVALYEGSQTRKAISQERDLLSGLTYQPIDIKALQKAATDASIADATQSLALQRSLQPNVARSNELLQKTVADELARGGNLPPDIANEVARAARTSTGVSGGIGNAAPYTAALIGQNALSILQQREANAAQLSAANPAPAVGLIGGDVASAMEANNNALNQFALAKAGGQASLINSTAQNNSGTAAGIGGSVGQALSLLALLGGKTGGSATLTPGQSAAVTGSPNQQGLGASPQSANGSIVSGFF